MKQPICVAQIFIWLFLVEANYWVRIHKGLSQFFLVPVATKSQQMIFDLQRPRADL